MEKTKLLCFLVLILFCLRVKGEETGLILENIDTSKTLYIFISFSMKDQLIKDYFLEARNLSQKKGTNIVFVLRGLYKNSFQATIDKVASLTQDNQNQQLGLIIDPLLFREYEINRVPVILMKYSDLNYNRIDGAITIDYALNKFEVE